MPCYVTLHHSVVAPPAYLLQTRKMQDGYKIPDQEFATENSEEFATEKSERKSGTNRVHAKKDKQWNVG